MFLSSLLFFLIKKVTKKSRQTRTLRAFCRASATEGLNGIGGGMRVFNRSNVKAQVRRPAPERNWEKLQELTTNKNYIFSTYQKSK
jgi:hypothetical protein